MVMGNGWPEHESEFTATRIFEYTHEAVAADHRRPDGQIDFDQLIKYPCLFMPERGADDEMAHVGYLSRVRPHGRGDVFLEYQYDPQIPAIHLDQIEGLQREFQMGDWEFTRTHWALKDVDLFRVLYRSLTPEVNRPSAFRINEPPRIDAQQMSVMMPFDPAFTEVYRTIQAVGAAVGMRVNRADDIWVEDAIIQDIVNLIDTSRIIVVDCSRKNANVFYEAGIAHALGRSVILISQSMEDVPFDLRHNRALTYLNNGEGRAVLQTRLESRVRTLLGLPQVAPAL